MVTNCPRPSTTARTVRENADNAAGSANLASRSIPLDRSRPCLVEPRNVFAARPASFNAGIAPGRRSAASDSAPIGSAANRSAGVTSFVTPPLLTNTRRSTICGYW